MITPVTFEIAKLLKEKGFNKRCSKAFLLKTFQPSNLFEDNISVIKDAENYSNSEFEKYYRPTTSEVVMWLWNTIRFGLKFVNLMSVVLSQSLRHIQE